MQSFPIAPADGRSTSLLLIIAVGVCLVVAFTAATLGRAWWAARSASFDVDATGLHLHAELLYRSHVPRKHLLPAQARVVDLATDPSVRPARRTMGTGLPGYQGGWFGLQNGQKALVYVTGHKRAAYLPTSDGYAVLLTVQDPDALVAAVRALDATPGR